MGKSRKPPQDEMLLAELIAAAKSRGLKACRGTRFLRSRDGFLFSSGYPDPGITHCCAAGAYILAKGREPSVKDEESLYRGNDAQGWDTYIPLGKEPQVSSLFTVGASFYDACKEGD